ASKAQARGANADSTAIAPPPVSVVSRSQGRVASVDAVPTKAPIGLAPPSAPQPAAPAGTHFAGPGKPAPVDHASASVDGPSAPPAAARPKLDEVTPVSADSVQQPDTQPQALLEVAPVDAASPAKTLTVVTKASPTAAVPSAAVGARLRDALVSVANHAVLRGEATGQIDVPELGRVAVRAHSAGGTVNVEVTAEAPEARAMLRGHVGAMTADLHAADVPVGRLTVDRAGASSGNSLGSSMSSRDRGASTGGESARDNRPQSDGDSAPAVVEAITPRRVRIVL
ncbi:MAG TPA: flagellar hook-length control protein FliK, partial [Polyangiaceae bacterium]|nr:flagellar hook-length control protein FliK [Polyangiaceae bacterium]